MAKPWDRQDGETAKSFAAFSIYLGQPSDQRSLAKVATQCGKSSGLIERWSRRDKWVDRVRAWDDQIATEDARRAAAKRLKELEDMRERHRAAGRLAMARAVTALVAEVDGLPKVQAENAVDVYRLAKTGLMLEASGHALGNAHGSAKMSGDDRGDGQGEDLPRLTKLEVEIIGDGGQRISIDDIAAKLRSFYDEPAK